MVFYLSQCALLVILVPIAQAMIMVESVDGSFVPWSLVARAPGDGIGVLLKNNNDLSYLTTVLMGTPPQQIQMAPSLSQNHISVATAPQGVSDSSFYNPAISTSFVQSDSTATVTTIPGGSTTGRFGGEVCTLQSATNSLFFTYNASVLLTDPTVTNDMYPIGARAVLGYGVDAPATSPQGTSLIGSFLPANFTKAICGIELNHLNDPVPDGILTMGAVDTSAFTGDFTNVIVPQVPNRPSWSIPFDSITFLSDGSTQSAAGLVASVDIYHSGIQVTSAMARRIYAGVPGSQAISDTRWLLPCNSTFPIILTFGGKRFQMFERDTVVKQSDGSCTGAITGGAREFGQVGAAFLRNVYTQFGADKASNGSVTFSVGFATKNMRQTLGGPTKTVTVTNVKPTGQTTISPSPSPLGSGGAPTILVQNAGFFSALAAVSIAGMIFL